MFFYANHKSVESKEAALRIRSPARLVVMLADPVHLRRKATRDLLYQVGVRQIVEVTSVRDAIARLRLGAIDLLVTDWMIQPWSSDNFIRRVRTDPNIKFHRLPIIAMLDKPGLAQIKHLRDNGVTTPVARPVKPLVFYRRMVAALNDRRRWVRASTYVGPCRRQKDDASWPGPERRENSSSGNGEPKTDTATQEPMDIPFAALEAGEDITTEGTAPASPDIDIAEDAIA